MSILTTNVSVNGVSTLAAVEDTHAQVAQTYDALVSQIASIAAYTSADYNNLSPAQQTALVQNQFSNFRALLSLGISGMDVGGTHYRVTTEMANSIDDLVRSLRAAGWDPSFPPGSVTESLSTLQRWSDLYNFGLKDIVTNAQKAADTNLNIQDLVLSEYISTGNTIVFNALTDLENQLEANKSALTSLTGLQNLMNDVTSALTNNDDFQNALTNFVNTWGTIPANPSPFPGGTNDAGAYDTAYTQATQDLFGKAIGVIAPSAGPNATSANVTAFTNAYNSLVQQIASLTDSIGDGPGTLTAALIQVKNDIDNATGNTADTLQVKFAAWIVDNMGVTEVGKAATAGNFQRNLTQAITQSENLNDTQKTRLQSQLFVFQEFYQSASAIMTALNTAITAMAQNISQG